MTTEKLSDQKPTGVVKPIEIAHKALELDFKVYVAERDGAVWGGLITNDAGSRVIGFSDHYRMGVSLSGKYFSRKDGMGWHMFDFICPEEMDYDTVNGWLHATCDFPLTRIIRYSTIEDELKRYPNYYKLLEA